MAELYQANGARDALFDQHLGRVFDEETKELASAADEGYRQLINDLRDRVIRNVRRIFTQGAERTTVA